MYSYGRSITFYLNLQHNNNWVLHFGFPQVTVLLSVFVFRNPHTVMRERKSLIITGIGNQFDNDSNICMALASLYFQDKMFAKT